MDAKEMYRSMCDGKISPTEFVAICLIQSGYCKGVTPKELLVILERDWALVQKDTLDFISDDELYDMAWNEYSDRAHNAWNKIENIRATLVHCVFPKCPFKQTFSDLKEFNRVNDFLDRKLFHGAEAREFQQKKLQELLPAINKTSISLSDVCGGDPEIIKSIRWAYKMMRELGKHL